MWPIFAISLIIFALPISMPRFKSIIFCQNSSKIKLFLHKNAKFLSAGGSAPRPLANFWQRARVTELLSGFKYNTAFDILNLRCAYINPKLITIPQLN